VDDGGFVRLLVNGNDGVDSFTLNDLLFDDWLSDVVNMVVNVFVNLLAKIDNSAFLFAVSLGIAVLRGQASKKSLVFAC